MPEIEEKNANNENTINLSDLKLITRGTRWVYDIPVTSLLIVRDKVCNRKNKIRIVEPGTGKLLGNAFVFRGLQEAYNVDTQKWNVIVPNPDTKDGRYYHDIGVGDDISLTIRVNLEVDKNYRSPKNLMLQQGAYIQAIRAKAETIKNLLVNKYYQNNSHESNLSEYRELKKEPFDLTKICQEALTTDDETIIKIAKEVIELQRDYGITMNKFEFTDIDYSDRIKQIIADDKEKEHQRQREIADAKSKIQIAKDEAIAFKTKITAEIEALKEKGFTNEQIAYYMNLKNLPKNAVALVGQPQGNMISDVMAANMVTNGMTSEQEEEDVLDLYRRSK